MISRDVKHILPDFIYPSISIARSDTKYLKGPIYLPAGIWRPLLLSILGFGFSARVIVVFANSLLDFVFLQLYIK